jgi:curved DNA-binding protein CbpA
MISTPLTLHDAFRDWLGIPEGQIPPDHYTLLGLPLFAADRQQIEQAARARARIVRPRCLKYHEVGTQLLNAIAAAHVCLTDPARKFEYDSRLRSGGRVAAMEFAAQTTPHLPLPALGTLFDQLEKGDANVEALLPPGLPAANQQPAQHDDPRPLAAADGTAGPRAARAKSAEEAIEAEVVEEDPPAQPRTPLPIVLAGLVRRGYMSLADELGHAAAIAACVATSALVVILAVVIGQAFNAKNEEPPAPIASTAAAADLADAAGNNPKTESANTQGSAVPETLPRETYVGRLLRIECRRDPVTSQSTVGLWLAAVSDPPTLTDEELPYRTASVYYAWSGEIEFFTSSQGFQAKIDDYESALEARDAWRTLQFGGSAQPEGDLVAIAVRQTDSAAAASAGPGMYRELIEVQRVGVRESRAAVDWPRDPETVDATRIARRMPIHSALRDPRGRDKTWQMTGTLTRTPDQRRASFCPAGSEVEAVIRSRGPVFPASGSLAAASRRADVEVFFTGEYDSAGQPVLELVSAWNWQRP